mmetsp:Transcript_7973/g.10463  ORF Transcript_7973/g.10463 Transcript_7973/m.10463 type:complete len:615 (-) Transcript_7973:308-2152(-)|eukprot:CAMPEP_0198145098 /NCGR_PEP_ID=MMETSP1443-20131203/21042_1 /TAXON_ID=186043 /ORGANISM="Entomoneis sp., Strain CCMP2396" /LENGTH=614 /DNA_ID=CAMNT_0043808627 /DNA_START=156 /DNA_END=2000 /DNA_ORIENTATION=-
MISRNGGQQIQICTLLLILAGAVHDCNSFSNSAPLRQLNLHVYHRQRRIEYRKPVLKYGTNSRPGKMISQRKYPRLTEYLRPIGSTQEQKGSATSLENASDAEAASSIRKRSVLELVVSQDFRDDFRNRRKVYASDWTDGFKNIKKCVPAILFLYFACLAPAVSFGTISSLITHDTLGIVEYMLSTSLSGMAYSLLCGQPMAFIAPTGLTLAFISGLYRFCTLNSLPFFPIYSWVGIWTSGYFIALGLGGAGSLIRYCTRFTDEVFNALLSVNFIYEALRSLRRNFIEADPSNLTMPFVSLSIAFCTWFFTTRTAAFEYSRYFNQKVRTFVKDFGPVSVFVIMSLVNMLRAVQKVGVKTLAVPKSFELSQGRPFWISLNAIPTSMKLFCAFPAILLCTLFFMDQNISVRVVNKSESNLKKPPAYNLDMVALGLVTLGLSFAGLPWMCGATVQSLNHVRAMTNVRFNKDTGETEGASVTETRLTGFMVHFLIFATLRLLNVLSFVPIPVVSGVFMFLGCKLMSGNSFLSRILEVFVQKARLPPDHPIRNIGRRKTAAFTAVQICCLSGLWAFKQNNNTAIFFPSVIGFLMVIRTFMLSKFFTEKELTALGDPTPA